MDHPGTPEAPRVIRRWSLAEANAAIPRVRELLAAARKSQSALREAQANLQDLRIVWGERLGDPSCPGHEEYKAFAKDHARARDELEARFLAFQALGCEPKDLDAGLVDFRGVLGDQEVYLCWREGETHVAWWHPMETGIAGRRPIPTQTSQGTHER